MNKSLLLVAVLTALVSSYASPAAHAQSYGGVEDRQSNTRGARHAANSKPAVMFPKATRAEPKQGGNPALSKTLNQIFDLYEKQKYDEALPKADAMLADPRATPYDRASAAYLAGYISLEQETGGYEKTLKYLLQALTENALTNNTHYQVMLQVAQMLTSDDKHADALTYVDRYLTETGSEDPKAYTLKANILYQLQRFPESVDTVKKAMAGNPNPDDNMVKLLVADYLEMDKPRDAAAAIEQLLVKTPNDKALLQNLCGVYQQAGDDAKAGQVFDRMRAAGLLTESKDYEFAYRLLANIEGREKDAVTIINEGLSKGILTPTYDVYAFLGNAYYDADEIVKAIEVWTKAAPMGKDGEMYLNLAKLQLSEDHGTEAKAAAHQALTKGVKKPGEAWAVIGNAELAANNKPAAIAAFREAAKYPETKKQAEAVLRQAGVK